MESFLFYTILVLMALFLLAWGNSFGGRQRALHPFWGRMASRAPSFLGAEDIAVWGRVTSRATSLLPGRGALLLYEHFVEKGVISPGIFLPFLTKRIALLPYEHFFQKGVIIWIPESPKIPDLLPIDDFLQKGVIFAEKNTPFRKKFLYRSKRRKGAHLHPFWGAGVIASSILWGRMSSQAPLFSLRHLLLTRIILTCQNYSCSAEVESIILPERVFLSKNNKMAPKEAIFTQIILHEGFVAGKNNF